MREPLLRDVHEGAIVPAYNLLPARMWSDGATVMLLVIGLQESRLVHRRQLVGHPPKPIGPAKGLWQFERGGGVAGVLGHPASRAHAERICRLRLVEPNSFAVWDALETDDVLAAAFARLLLWTDPQPLSGLDDVGRAWDYYLRNWRPGKPHLDTWPAFHQRAVSFVRGQ